MKKLFRIGVFVVTSVLLVAGCSKVTKENYDKVKVGMTKDQVIEILGKPADKSEAEIAGLELGKLETWSWNSSGYGGKFIMISFQKGRVSDRHWSE